jgi:hypothetical protein
VKEIDAYHKSPFFHKLVETIHNIYGDDMNVICCDINYDAMPADGICKRSLKPLKMRLNNVGYDLCIKQKNVINIALGPLILNTDAQLLTLMKGQIFSAGRRKSALRFCKRRLSPEFMAHAISPMLETLNVRLQLAIGITRRIYKVIIIPTLLVNNNEEAWSLLNFITRSRHRSYFGNVSLHTVNNSTVYFDSPFRNAKYLHELNMTRF